MTVIRENGRRSTNGALTYGVIGSFGCDESIGNVMPAQ